ncbi:MAG: AraC family transcriptional regulator [Tenericutes bacterium HGW-Tenericutes-5]|jgi:AraC-like DNA-binding protein|nr:MAG: AraC family transcriptional regulator [Tenericutes bacterium HGW-Tenericutes-5]
MSEEKIRIVKEIQKFIKANIKNQITLSDISKHVNYSLWYSARIFKEVVGMSVFTYIRRMRLTHAAQVLRDTDSRVIDVAFDFVFDSHEGFTRAFAKEFSVNPKEYQKSPIPLQYFIPFEVMENSIERKSKKMDAKAVFIQIIERPLRKAIVKRAKTANNYFEYCDEIDCDIWGVLSSIKEAISEPVGMWLSNKLKKENTSTYIQGVEVSYDYQGIIPEGCELMELPASMMMIFQGEPYDDDNFREEVGQVMNYITKYDPSVYGYEYDEDGYRFQYEPQGYRGYIEGRTVKKLG